LVQNPFGQQGESLACFFVVDGRWQHSRRSLPGGIVLLGKVNVVADALSRKAHCNHLELEPVSDPLCEEMRRLNLEVVPQGNLYALAAESNLYDRIVTAQRTDEDIQTIKQKLAEGDPKYTCFQKDHQDVI
jgi:hypothetical protein